MGRSSRPFLVIPVRASPISQPVLGQLAKRLRKRQRRRMLSTPQLNGPLLIRRNTKRNNRVLPLANRTASQSDNSCHCFSRHGGVIPTSGRSRQASQQRPDRQPASASDRPDHAKRIWDRSTAGPFHKPTRSPRRRWRAGSVGFRDRAFLRSAY